ncbi:hypothetical protein HY772_06500 [Candidatus Woesearchaeota archaeon]|nr:hypothetical protein [Candidatus Woesearchaeota archaeon]
MQSRKSQLKMGETVAILFIFFILLTIGAVFYFNIKRASVTREGSEQFELKAVEITQSISFLPEAQCTESNVVKASCFDLYKLIALASLKNDPKIVRTYEREFGQSALTIRQVYPPGANYTIYENPPPQFNDASTTNIPISLYNATADRYYFGVLEVKVYR